MRKVMQVKDFRYILIPVISVITAQLFKFTMESIHARRFRWGRLFNGTGGMPSSHTVYTFSLTMAIGLGEGFSSSIFAVALIFSCIVAYDAMGLRMESGKQAEAINLLYDKLFDGDLKQGVNHLKEQLGHKPIEVLVGVLYAVISAVILSRFF